ncbi:hypothetical protein HMI54_010794 [Coelomomyces lativittatus]|nr:hypothetical protein HMI54_010794 [Coelomomyces lativittatus]
MRLTTCLSGVLPLLIRTSDAFPRSQYSFCEGVGLYFPPGLMGSEHWSVPSPPAPILYVKAKNGGNAFFNSLLRQELTNSRTCSNIELSAYRYAASFPDLSIFQENESHTKHEPPQTVALA